VRAIRGDGMVHDGEQGTCPLRKLRAWTTQEANVHRIARIRELACTAIVEISTFRRAVATTACRFASTIVSASPRLEHRTHARSERRLRTVHQNVDVSTLEPQRLGDVFARSLLQ
jgi:hypothetical protein